MVHDIKAETVMISMAAVVIALVSLILVMSMISSIPAAYATPTIAGSNISDTSESVASFQSAKQQYLSAWNNTDFHSEFDTFIEEFSVTAYGVYTERESNVTFSPGESIELYVEPVGFAYNEVYDLEGNILYQTNFTANISVFDKQGNQTLVTEYDIPDDNYFRKKVTEHYLTIPLQPDTPLPEGEYTVRYIITDAVSGKTMEIQRDIRIVEEEEVI